MKLIKHYAADGFYCRIVAGSYTFQAWFPYSDYRIKHDNNRLVVPSPHSLDEADLQLYEKAFAKYMWLIRNPPNVAKTKIKVGDREEVEA